VFNLLRQIGFNVAFIIDPQYHKNTAYYLFRSNFYVLGVVPTSNKMYFLDFVIPVGTENFSSQFFFIRLITQSKLLTYNLKYKALKYN
jgi:hypothetical protein